MQVLEGPEETRRVGIARSLYRYYKRSTSSPRTLTPGECGKFVKGAGGHHFRINLVLRGAQKLGLIISIIFQNINSVFVFSIYHIVTIEEI